MDGARCKLWQYNSLHRSIVLGLGNTVSDSARSWTPSDLPGLRLWYKFNQGLENESGAFPANTEEIEVWRDQSGNANDATATTDDVTYNGTEKCPFFLTVQSKFEFQKLVLGECSIFLRLKFQTGQNIDSGDIFADSATTNDFIKIQNNSSGSEEVRWKVNGSNKKFAPTEAFVVNEKYNLCFDRSAGGVLSAFMTSRADSTALNPMEKVSAADSAITNTFTTNTLFGGNDMFFYEMLVFTENLHSTDRNKLNEYLNSEN